MGSHAVRAVRGIADLSLVASIDTAAGARGEDIGSLVGLGALDVVVSRDLEAPLPRQLAVPWRRDDGLHPSRRGCMTTPKRPLPVAFIP